MSRFYCRDEELRKLNKRYENGKFECVVIYGRRRVGKTALINEFCKDKPTIFFSALNTTGKENLEALSKAIMSFERPNAESSPEFTTYDAALDELTALSKEQRIVFVIDEYLSLEKYRMPDGVIIEVESSSHYLGSFSEKNDSSTNWIEKIMEGVGIH